MVKAAGCFGEWHARKQGHKETKHGQSSIHLRQTNSSNETHLNAWNPRVVFNLRETENWQSVSPSPTEFP